MEANKVYKNKQLILRILFTYRYYIDFEFVELVAASVLVAVAAEYVDVSVVHDAGKERSSIWYLKPKIKDQHIHFFYYDE